MFTKLLKTLLVSFLLFFIVAPATAGANEVNVYFFWGEGCPHCATEKPALEELQKKYSELKVYSFEIYYDQENSKLLTEIAKKLEASVSGVPLTIIADQTFTGFSPVASIRQFEEVIQYCLVNTCPDSVYPLISAKITPTPTVIPVATPGADVAAPLLPTPTIPAVPRPSAGESDLIFDLPFVGQIDLKGFSLPAITIILGALDGFNPCAMWTLIFLISLLLGIEDKKRRWILGTAFIATSAFVYFLFMAAWLNILLFLGFIFWVRIAIGAIALFGGGYNLREYINNPDGSCKVTGGEKRQAIFTKLKEITQQSHFLLALAGIIILAFAVNLVELVCSAGLPVIFTQILTLNNLSTPQYYMYMGLYILFFMLDDLFIFFTAMVTLEITGLSTKYSRYSHLIGGLLMLAFGLLFIFKPELLMFG